ncbi:substrate-binding domain-containing protein [Burkholderia cepacia]|uniref:substrate-binding domain-containing protein n=1 Tax=Burkholderia cepacia TaxID=292 RepID=UPI00298F5FB8|nr:substrate-binding domain-containing protein [Burkholderia cepacia]
MGYSERRTRWGVLRRKKLPPDTRGIELSRMTFCVVAPALWRNRIEGASWSDASLMPWIRASKPSANHDMVMEILQRVSIKPVEIVEADHEFIILTLVSAGVGIGLLREELALQAQERGEVIVMSEKAESSLWFIYHGNRESDPAIQAAIESLRQTWNL